MSGVACSVLPLDLVRRNGSSTCRRISSCAVVFEPFSRANRSSTGGWWNPSMSPGSTARGSWTIISHVPSDPPGTAPRSTLTLVECIRLNVCIRTFGASLQTCSWRLRWSGRRTGVTCTANNHLLRYPLTGIENCGNAVYSVSECVLLKRASLEMTGSAT